MHWWDGSWHWTMMLGMALFWLIILIVVIWALRSLLGPRGGGGESPEAVLKRRYASGELSKEEYQERLREIRR
jgi:putative membrane protein